MQIKKALTFRASSIGDCLMGKYLLENIHDAFPDARCGIVVASRGAMIRDLLAAYPWIEIVEVNIRQPLSFIRLMRRFWHSDAVTTQYSGNSFSLPSKFAARLLARRGALVGFVDKSPWNRFLYDRLLPLAANRSRSPRLLEHDVLAALGIQIAFEYPTLARTLRPEVLRRLQLETRQYILVHLFSGSDKRGFSPERRRVLINTLAQSLSTETEIILTGTSSETEAALYAAKGTRAKVATEKTTLQEMMCLIEQSGGVVAVDTGIAHIAAQLSAPLAVLSTCLGLVWWLPEQYGPRTPHIFSIRAHRPDEHVFDDFPSCINDIDMAEVARAAALLKR